MKWLERNKVVESLHFVINEQICIEFDNKIQQFSEQNRITNAEAILDKFDKHYKNKIFRVIGQEIISTDPSKVGKSIKEINNELNLSEGKDDWDGLIYQSIINHLAFLAGESHPILVTSDSRFADKVKVKGYRVINPEKQSIEEIMLIINSEIK